MLLPEFIGLWLVVLGVAGASPQLPPEDFETVETSNAAILNRLGLHSIQAPDGHHRKRLAGPHPNLLAEQHKYRTAAAASSSYHRNPQHEHHQHQHQHQYQQQQQQQQQQRHIAGLPQDSHVYVVKLPASPAYYSFARPHRKSELLGLGALGQPGLGERPSVGFQGNGKPGSIYHWNLPIVRKLATSAKKRVSKLKLKLKPSDNGLGISDSHRKLQQQQHHHQQQLGVGTVASKPSRSNDKWLLGERRAHHHQSIPAKDFSTNHVNKAYRIDDQQQQQQQHQPSRISTMRPSLRTNEVPGGASSSSSSSSSSVVQSLNKSRKHRKKAASTSYYLAPELAAGGKLAASNLQKFFPGNGKPKAFYVMEKSRKPVYYHPLLP